MRTDLSDTHKNKMWNARGAFRGEFMQNVISLYLIQFLNYLLPLITLPYLVRVLGPEKFGVVAFGQGLMAFLSLLVSYGFDWSATREISTKRHDKASVNGIVVSVWAAKLLLAAGSFLLLLLLVLSVQKIRDYTMVLFVLYGIVLGTALVPTWLFQGLEKMPALLSINIVVRVAGTAAIFLGIHDESDFVFYAGLLSLQSIATGGIAAWVAYRRFDIDFHVPSWRDVKNSLRSGWTLFLSTASVGLYTAGNSFILGLLANNIAVGYYSGAERIVRLGSSFLGPMTQAAYPRSSRVAVTSSEQALSRGRKLVLVMGVLGFLISFLLIVFASKIVDLILGDAYAPSISIMQILAASIFLKAMTNVWGIQIMLPFGHDRAFLAILFLAGVLSVLLAFVLVPHFGGMGMAIAVLTAETVVTIIQASYLKKKGLLL